MCSSICACWLTFIADTSSRGKEINLGLNSDLCGITLGPAAVSSAMQVGDIHSQLILKRMKDERFIICKCQ